MTGAARSSPGDRDLLSARRGEDGSEVHCASCSSQDRDAGGIYSYLAEVAWLSQRVRALLHLNSLGSKCALLLQAESKKKP